RPTTRAASIPSRRVTISASNMETFSVRLPGPPGGGRRDPRAGSLRCGRHARAVAALAVAADLGGVAGHAELVPGADLVLEPLDVPALELDDRAAAQAYHVIVVVAPEHRLLPPPAPPPRPPPGGAGP